MLTTTILCPSCGQSKEIEHRDAYVFRRDRCYDCAPKQDQSTARPDFTYQDYDSYVMLTARTPRASAKIRDDIRPRDSFSGIVAILDPEEAKRVRCILTEYEGFTVETITP